MASTSREALIAARVSAETKAKFALLAADRGLSESALLTLLLDTVLDQNGTLRHAEGSAPADIQGPDRVTLRLRPGDRTLVDVRATARGMKPASYLVALVHAHVRSNPPLPRSELRELKLAVAELSATKRSLDPVRLGLHAAGTIDVMRSLHDTATRAEEVRRYVADLVRSNLVSWEAADA